MVNSFSEWTSKLVGGASLSSVNFIVYLGGTKGVRSFFFFLFFYSLYMSIYIGLCPFLRAHFIISYLLSKVNK